jgi:HNH endonuclease
VSSIEAHIVRTLRPNERFINADTDTFDAEERQLSEPVRVLLSEPQIKPKIEQIRDDDSDSQLKLLRAILRGAESRVSSSGTTMADHLSIFQVDTVASMLETDRDTTRSVLNHGSEYVISHYITRRRANVEADWRATIAQWEAGEQARIASHRFWIFRGKLVEVDGWESAGRDEIVTRVKHKVLKEEKLLKRLEREIELMRVLEEGSESLRRARERIPLAVRTFVFLRDGGRCRNCGSTENIQYDHIIPVARGGGNTEDNIEILCQICNQQKGATV